MEFTDALQDWEARVRTGKAPVGGRKARREARTGQRRL